MSEEGVNFENIHNSSIHANIIAGRDVYNYGPQPTITDQTSKFDCGHRLKWLREVLKLTPAEWVAFINYPSEKEWRLVEQRKQEVADEIITRVATLTGMSAEWLRTGIGRKMPLVDWDLRKVSGFLDELEVHKTTNLYVLTTSACRHLTFVAYSEPNCYRLYDFGFGLDFWNWDEDFGYIPFILILGRAIVRKYPLSCYTFYTDPLRYWQFEKGERHPRELFGKQRGFRYFLEDLVTGGGEDEYGYTFKKVQAFLAKEGVKLGHNNPFQDHLAQIWSSR